MAFPWGNLVENYPEPGDNPGLSKLKPFATSSSYPRGPAVMNSSSPIAQILRKMGGAPHPPRAHAGPQQIPWSDPAFSARMLEVHLDPTTHMASRQPEVIQKHTDWLAAHLRATGRPADQTHILDVGCGPGLYQFPLAEQGFRNTGIDFAPEALIWARQEAQRRGLDCTFLELDLTALPEDLPRQVGPVDAITFWFGEFHSFRRDQARDFLPRLAACLRPGGTFYLEYQPWDLFVQEDATEWSWEEQSVFCDTPHLWLQEFGWDARECAEVHVHWILDLDSGKLDRYQQCHFAWTEEELVAALKDAGLVDPVFHEPIAQAGEEFEFPVLAVRRAAP